MRVVHDHIVALKEFIEGHLDETLSISVIADNYCVSISTLRKQFKKQYSIPLYKFILKQRMERAMLMLKERRHSITDISLMVGYNDLSNFTHAFTNYFGATPSCIVKNFDETAK
ncbi:helix-turn-helix transcriptional regulator [Pedobacter insulae]|uniref:AraC-type DNA-binding protein n=1 Tax=Pedobacter insulae TaxID=414048 RepID=A0A1I2ZKU9_9SPHI|nr:AraC family transcriptional regulator [Pedobacter insulae]SFH37741.1 AraC-type DNA-binding protein [Pedobacter insulae]